MTDVLGDVLPLAVAVALSPFPVVAIVLVLATPRAKANGVAFAIGWLLGLSLLTAVVLVAAGRADDPSSRAATAMAWVRVALGVGLLGAAGAKWRKRRRPGDERELPGWMTGLESLRAPRAALLGAALGGANPKNLALTLAAASAIAQAGLSGADTLADAIVFVVLASSTVVGAVVVHLIAPERSARPLASIERFMLDNNEVIMMLIFLFFGAKLLGDGLDGI